MALQHFSVSVNNQKVTSFIHLPANTPQGVVLFCHGFPGTNRLPPLARILNDRGVGIVELNYRGDEACDGVFSFLGSIEDVEEGAKELRKKFPDVPLTALGFSAGGLYVSIAVRHNPDLFDRVVLLNPLVDASVLSSDNPIMGRLWDEAGTVLTLQKPDVYAHEIETLQAKHNPIEFAGEITTPIELVVSTNDGVLPAAVAQKFYEKLKGEKSFVWIEGAKHGVSGDEKETVETLLS